MALHNYTIILGEMARPGGFGHYASAVLAPAA